MALADYIGKYWTGTEAIYGVIIVMTFTSVLRGNPVVFKQMLSTTIYSSLACCIAWGITQVLCIPVAKLGKCEHKGQNLFPA